jgi:hypothetical protein
MEAALFSESNIPERYAVKLLETCPPTATTQAFFTLESCFKK